MKPPTRFLTVMVGLFLLLSAFSPVCASNPSTLLHFDVIIKNGLVNTGQTGRLFVLLGTGRYDPRFALGEIGRRAPLGFACDVQNFWTNTVLLGPSAAGYPVTNLALVPAREYQVQAVLEQNSDLRIRHAPGDLFSTTKRILIDPAVGTTIRLELNNRFPDDAPPKETDLVRFLKIKSAKLSAFHGRPIYLRAGVLLPADYEKNSPRRYPLWISIGGFGTRYTEPLELVKQRNFRNRWMAEGTPRFIRLQLDGAGPLGDPYYVNSDVLGPYGDALMEELLPEVDRQFRTLGTGSSRVLSGTSTGGWVSLALQIFYPDSFAGAWASCPDPLDFRELETTDIYREKNIYVNANGYDRPSARDLDGDIRYTLRDEIRMERFIGRGGNFLLSGQQWASWHAVYSPRDSNGLPKPLFDPHNGAIDPAVAEHWKKYDLRDYLQKNWSRIGPNLRGKIHIAAAEADEYFLANAIRLLDRFLAGVNPPAEAEIVYGPGEGHGWSYLTLPEMLDAMQRAVAPDTPSRAAR